MTEGNQSVMLHVESWNRVTNILREIAFSREDPSIEAMADTIDAQRPTDSEELEPEGEQSAVGFCGLPGSGKSLAADRFADIAGGTAISMGDAIRNEYVKELHGKSMSEIEEENYEGVMIDSEALGDFAADARSEDPAQIPEWVTDLAAESDEDLIAIDGVRSVKDYEVLNDYFDRFLLIRITAPFYERFERIVGRGREGEDGFTEEDLLDRDRHELEELGYADLLDHDDDWADDYLPDSNANFNTGYVNVVIDNSGPLRLLDENLATIASRKPWLPTPEPDSLDS